MPAARPPDLTQPIPGYEVLEQLGSGGMSSVYRARHKGLDRQVAIKVIRRDQIDPGLALARLTKEARVLSRLDHPAIVRSIDFGEAGELVYFVLELVEGRSCKQLLIERGKLPLREVLFIGEKVAQALGHAAAHGVIHRDVKPANILLAKDGAVKLTDFGLARATRDRSLTQDGITVGTPQYMSPEQVKSPRRVDLRSDLYSLGATLYHLATGEAPFRGDNVGEILHDVLYSVPRPPEQLEPTLPASFSRVLARLLAKDARRRYASARELLADLERVRGELAGSLGEAAVGLSWQEAAEPPPTRWRPPLLVGAALLVAGVSAFALLQGGGERPDPIADAKAHEERILAALAADLAGGREPPASILAKIGDLKRDGTLTIASGVARVELRAKAIDALERQLDEAAIGASAPAGAALARADFAGSARAFDEAFARRVAELAPPSLRDALAAADADPQESVRRRAARRAGDLEALVQKVRGEVSSRLLREHERLIEEVDVAIAAGRLQEARALLDGYASRERATCIAATRDALAAAGVALAPDVGDDEVARGWPESVRNEIEREPAATLVQFEKDALDDAIRRRQRDLLASIRAARDADAALVEQGTVDLDPARRRAELAQELQPQIEALASVEALPAELDAEWADYDEKVGSTRARVVREREQAALLKLLDNESDEKPGLVSLLMDKRNVEGARALLAAAEGLAPRDAAAWRQAIEDVDAVLAAARAALQAAVGSEVALTDRGRVTFRGKVTDGGNSTFSVGVRAGVKVEALSLSTLDPHVDGAIEGEGRRVAVRFLLGDAKDHAAQEEALARLTFDPVLDALRRVRDYEKLGAAKLKDKLDGEARDARAKLDQAFAKREAGAAAAAWALLQSQRYAKTPTGIAAIADRSRIEAAIAELKRSARTEAMLRAVAPNAGEESVAPDGSIRFHYGFDKVEEGKDFGLYGNAIRVENGRLFFVGGDGGARAREEGPVLRLPIDRRAPATLSLELYAPLDEPRDPHFVGIRLSGICVAFYRPDEPKGETFEPQLVAWFGALNEFPAHVFDPLIGQVEPRIKGVKLGKGLQRGLKHAIEVRWLPENAPNGAPVEVWLDGDRAFQLAGAMTTPPESDGIELRSATALQIDAVSFHGRLKE